MKISNYITENQIHIGIAHKRKRDIFKELLTVLVKVDKLNQNITKLESYAKGLDRNDILVFLKWVRKEFNDYL